MKLIDAQSAVPTNDDGLIVYSGSYSNTTNAQLSVTIRTQLRHRFFVSMVAENELIRVSGAIPAFERLIIQLGYLETTNTNGEISFETVIPPGYFLTYLIMGTTLKATPLHSDQVVASGSGKPQPIGKLKAAIAAAGTSAIEFLNNTGNTFTYSKAATGVYAITSNNAFFTTNKVFPLCTFEGADESYPAGWTVTCTRESNTVMHVRTYLDGALTDWGRAIFLSVETYP